MKICILDDADPSTNDFHYQPEMYLEGHTFEKHYLLKTNSIDTIRQLATKNFDVFLNQCCGSWDENDPGIEVVQALEKYQLAFTGADSKFYEPTREDMKMVCETYGLNFPAGVQVRREKDLHRAMNLLKFPLLVKHPNSYASIGLTKDSVVHNEEELRKQYAIMKKAFGGALVEEFIEGKEYSVLVVQNPKDKFDPIIFAPIEIVFADGETFKHEKLKWVDYGKISVKPVADKKISDDLEDMAKKVFAGLHGTGYGRCDIRMDKNGVLYLLEINPNGAVFYPPSDPGTADHILQIDPRGHKFFVKNLLESALIEREMRCKGWEVQYSPETGFCATAKKNYAAGDFILSLEELPHRLLSEDSLDKFPKDEQARIKKYSFPVCEKFVYAPAEYPAEWTPIRHSCSPNAWFKEDTLVLIAKKAITKGEPITIDYATMYAEDLSEFKCKCEEKNCRKVITPEDYLKLSPEMKKHSTPFVKNKTVNGSTRLTKVIDPQ